jgi:hypothetical protein
MALVNLMTPGLAFFYGGLVRQQNVLSIMMQNYVSMGRAPFVAALAPALSSVSPQLNPGNFPCRPPKQLEMFCFPHGKTVSTRSQTDTNGS